MTYKTSYSALILLLSACNYVNAATSHSERNCAVGDEQQGCVLYELSMIELIANPEKFAGKKVLIFGYAIFDKVRYEESGDSIYISKEAADHGFLKDGLWLDLANSALRTQVIPSDGYVLLEGTFSAGNQGHFSQWSGSIPEITIFERRE